MTFVEYDGVMSGTITIQCPKCRTNLEIGFSPGSVSFVLRDGPSGGWASKAIKENRYRASRHRIIGQRQKDHVFTPTLQPNYMGEETGTWRNAQEMARKELGDAAASTYNFLIQGNK